MEWRLLRGVPEDDVRRLVKTARRRRFKRDEILFHEGDPADTLHLIAKGRVAVQVNTPMGEHTTVDVLGSGDCVGELALLDAEPRSATVVALEATETLAIHRAEFERLRDAHPQVSAVLARVLASRLRIVSQQVVEAVYAPVERRVLRRLVRLLDLYGDGADEVVVPLTQEHLAGLAATTRSTVNRILRREEKDGVIRLTRGRVTIIDPSALRDKAK